MVTPEVQTAAFGLQVNKIRARWKRRRWWPNFRSQGHLGQGCRAFYQPWHDFQKHQLSTLIIWFQTFETPPSSMLLDHVRLNFKKLQPFPPALVLDILEGHRWHLGVSRQLWPNAIAISGCSVPSLHNRISFFFPSGLQVGLPPELQAASHLTHWIVL